MKKLFIYGIFLLFLINLVSASSVSGTQTGQMSLSESSPFSSAGALPSSMKPVCKVKIAEGNVNNVGAIPVEGLCRLIAVNAGIIFNVDGNEHTLEISELNKTYARFKLDDGRIESANYLLEEGKTSGFGISDDKEIRITFYKGYPKKYPRYADMLIKVTKKEKTSGGGRGSAEPNIPESEEQKILPEPKSNIGMVLTVLVIIVIIVIGYFMIRKKPEEKEDEK